MLSYEKTVNLILNGKQVVCEVHEHELLLYTLRERFSLKSVKEGCGIGECGTCTVLIDDDPHYACLTLASKVDGHDVKTVEFLGDAGMLHPLQEAFIKHGAVQCGYCTPGMLLSAYSLLLKNREPDREMIREAISGNLCRCTGYVQIVEAVGQAAQRSAFSVQRSAFNGSRRPTLLSSAWPGLQPANTMKTKEEVFSYLAAVEDAKVIAGGTDLLIALRKGEVQGHFIDVTDVPGLSGVTHNNGNIRIGVTTTHARVSTDTLVRNHAKSLSLACGWIGSPQIRNMGTIGGNLVNASPAADTIPPLLIHDAILTLESSNPPTPPFPRTESLRDRYKGGQEGLESFVNRRVKLEDFIIAPYKTSIKPYELLTSVSLKGLVGYREGYRRVTKRATWAIARLSVAWAIHEEDGIYKDVRLAIGSCTPMPFRPAKVEAFLKGSKKEKGIIVESIEMILKEIKEMNHPEASLGVSTRNFEQIYFSKQASGYRTRGAITGIRPSFVYKIPVLKGILENVLGGQ